MARSIDWSNFHDATAGSWTRCERPTRAPDFASPSGSLYWRDGEGVIRESDHWCCGIRSCDWFLDGGVYVAPGEPMTGCTSYQALAASTAEREAARRAACESRLAELERTAQLKRPGERVQVTRSVCERLNSRRFRRVEESVVFVISRFTANFVVADDGRRFALHTIRDWRAATA